MEHLSPDPAKKSVFWLGRDPSLVVPDGEDSPEPQRLFSTASPAEASFDSSAPWAIGGFQLVSNSQQVKVYLTPPNQNEAYLTTVKGLPVTSTTNKDYQTTDEVETSVKLFKSMCVIPGGVRPVSRVRLVFEKLDQTSKDTDEVCRIQWVKLTARIVTADGASTNSQRPEGVNSVRQPQMMQSLFGGPPGAQMPRIPSGVSANSQQEMMMMQAMMMGKDPSSKSQSTPQFPARPNDIQSAMQIMSLNGGQVPGSLNSMGDPSAPVEPPATASDLSASMAGLNFSLRSTEERILKKVKASQDVLQSRMMQQQQQYIASLQQIILQQNAWIHQQLVQQESRIKEYVSATLNGHVEIESPSPSKRMTNEVDEKKTTATSKAPSTGPLWQQYASLETPK